MSRGARPVRALVVHAGARLGGSETWLARVLPAARDLEAQVVLLSAGPFSGVLESLGVEVEVIPTSRSARDLAHLTRHLASRARQWPADLIVADGVKAATLGVAAGALARVPVVWLKHDHAYDRTLGWLLARVVRAMAGTSAELVAAAGRPHASVLPVPRPPGVAASRADAARYWQARGLDLDRRPLAVFVGRLVPSKGVEDAIRALATDAASDWHLVVVGDDDASAPGERRRLEAVAERTGVADRVSWVGEVDGAGEWLAAFDAVVVPTARDRHITGEGFGLVVLEGLLAGVPVAASAGIPALGLAEGAAVAFRPESPDDLGRALAATRACTDAAQRRGEELRRDYPDADVVAAAFVKLVAAAARGDRSEIGGPR